MATATHEYVAERYEPGATEAQIEADAAKLASTTDTMRAAGEQIEFLGTTFMPSDEASFSWFRSSSPELVETVHKCAAVPLERVVLTLSLPHLNNRGRR